MLLSICFPCSPAIKHLPTMQETQETRVWSLGWEDSPGGRNGNLLQYSCLENPMDRGAWWATVHGVERSQTQLNTHAGSYQTEEALFYFCFYEFFKNIRNRYYILLFYASVDTIIWSFFFGLLIWESTVIDFWILIRLASVEYIWIIGCNSFCMLLNSIC